MKSVRALPLDGGRPSGTVFSQLRPVYSRLERAIFAAPMVDQASASGPNPSRNSPAAARPAANSWATACCTPVDIVG